MQNENFINDSYLALIYLWRLPTQIYTQSLVSGGALAKRPTRCASLPAEQHQFESQAHPPFPLTLHITLLYSLFGMNNFVRQWSCIIKTAVMQASEKYRQLYIS